MNDNELLELAAKAAGTEIQWDQLEHVWYRETEDYPGNPEWNPLTDDGDALRLAVKVLNWPHGGSAFNNAVNAMYAVGQLSKDPYAATRRAIVRAAAAIGEEIR